MLELKNYTPDSPNDLVALVRWTSDNRMSIFWHQTWIKFLSYHLEFQLIMSKED